MLENNAYIKLYSQRADANNTLDRMLYKHKPFVIHVICCKFLQLNYFLIVIPIKHILPCRKIGDGQPMIIF